MSQGTGKKRQAAGRFVNCYQIATILRNWRSLSALVWMVAAGRQRFLGRLSLVRLCSRGLWQVRAIPAASPPPTPLLVLYNRIPLAAELVDL